MLQHICYVSTWIRRIVCRKDYLLAGIFQVGKKRVLKCVWNNTKFYAYSLLGACHADDCSYYFRSEFAGPDPPKHSDEWKTIERMCDSFTSFARTGDPNNDSIAPVEWQPIKLEPLDDDAYKYKCLNVSNEVSYIDWPELDRMRFWDQVYKQFNNNSNINV